MEAERDVVIEAGKASLFPDLREAWAARTLLAAFVRRGMAVRYRQAAFGLFWAILQPAVTVAIFTLVFSYVAKLPSGDLPYSVFAAIGMTAWIYFARGLQDAANSLVVNEPMVTKVWFPRILLPLALIVEGLIEYGVMLALVAGLMAWHAIMPTWTLLLYPVFLLPVIVTGAGLALWFSALNVSFRDVRVILPFLLQAGMFATPIVWSPESLSPAMTLVVALNPIAVAIDGMRWAAGGEGVFMTPGAIGICAAMTVLTLVSGAMFFARRERHFADVI